MGARRIINLSLFPFLAVTSLGAVFAFSSDDIRLLLGLVLAMLVLTASFIAFVYELGR